MEKRTILITGGSGLVGFALKAITHKYPQYSYVFLSSRECDLTDYNETLNMFQRHSPWCIIHLAACVGGLYKNMNQKVSMFEKNMLINMNVLRASYECGAKKFIGCLSTCIFPDKTTYPINETMLHNGPPHCSNDAYAYAKRMLEVQCRIYRETYGLDYMCIIPTNIYGPNDNYHLADAHVIPALIRKCWNASDEGSPFVILGTGKPVRQFIYSLDVAEIIMLLIGCEKKIDNIIVSVGEEDEVSISDVGYLVAQEFDYTNNIVFDASYSDGQYKKTADNSLLRSLFPEFVFTGIKEGIHESVQWFLRNKHLPATRL